MAAKLDRFAQGTAVVDLLVNNAGIETPGVTWEIAPERLA